MKSLEDLVADITKADDALSEITIPAGELTVDEGGILWKRERLAFENPLDGLIGMLDGIGAPTRYLKEKMPAYIHAQLINAHIQRGDFGEVTGVLVRNGQVVNFFRGDLIRLNNAEVLTAIAEGIGPEAAGLMLAKVEINIERLEVELITRQKSIEVRQGDVVYGGMQLIHSHLGNQATVIQTFMQRLVCTNGMTRRECASMDGISRTRRLPLAHPNGKELQLDQVRQLANKTWQSIQGQLAELAVTAERHVEVEPTLATWLRRARLSHARLMERLLEAWQREGSESTEYGLVNALTRVATHDASLTHRERRMLAALGGLLAGSHAHICPRCFSVLQGGAENLT